MGNIKCCFSNCCSSIGYSFISKCRKSNYPRPVQFGLSLISKSLIHTVCQPLVIRIFDTYNRTRERFIIAHGLVNGQVPAQETIIVFIVSQESIEIIRSNSIWMHQEKGERCSEIVGSD